MPVLPLKPMPAASLPVSARRAASRAPPEARVPSAEPPPAWATDMGAPAGAEVPVPTDRTARVAAAAGSPAVQEAGVTALAAHRRAQARRALRARAGPYGWFSWQTTFCFDAILGKIWGSVREDGRARAGSLPPDKPGARANRVLMQGVISRPGQDLGCEACIQARLAADQRDAKDSLLGRYDRDCVAPGRLCRDLHRHRLCHGAPPVGGFETGKFRGPRPPRARPRGDQSHARSGEAPHRFRRLSQCGDPGASGNQQLELAWLFLLRSAHAVFCAA